MNKGDVVIYKPVNQITGKHKTDHPDYGKEAIVTMRTGGNYYIEIEGRKIFAFGKEVERE